LVCPIAPFVTTTIILPSNAKDVPNVKAIEDVARKGFDNVKMLKGHNVEYLNHGYQR
jgi:hypothetical protein